MNRKRFNPKDLHLVKSVDHNVNRNFQIGQHVQLNSGGKIMMVVDVDDVNITIAYISDNKPTEFTINRICLTPINLSELE